MLQRLSYAFRGLAKLPVGFAWRRGIRGFTASRIHFNATGPSAPHSRIVVPPSGSAKPPIAPARPVNASVNEPPGEVTEVDPTAEIDINSLSDKEFIQFMQFLDAKIAQGQEGQSSQKDQSLEQKAGQMSYSKHPDPEEQVHESPSDSATSSHDPSAPKPFSPFGNSFQAASQPLRSQVGSGPLSASSSSIQAYSSASSSHEIQPTLDIPPESDPLLAYLTSHLMRHGKRHTAARRTSRMLLHIFAMTRSRPLPIFRHAVELAAPSIRIVSQKRGGKMLHKPIPLSEKQRTFFAIKWMLTAASNNRGKTIEERLAKQVLDIIRQDDPTQNQVLKKKLDLHTMGMVNRANVRTRPAS